MLLGGLPVYLYFRWQEAKKNHREAIADLQNWMNTAEHQLRQTFNPGCASRCEAVSYDSWDGTIQTFTFANDQFAAAFLQANQSKVV